MAIEIAQTVIESDWHNCYKKRWNGRLVEAAYAHPAKVSHGLAERIYEHAIAEGWLCAGSHVVDCFGGIAGFAYHATLHGLHFTGVELEEKFVTLGNQNIELWNSQYKGRLPLWGSARLLQGDSRNLAGVLKDADCLVSSPPYSNDTVSNRNGINPDLIKSSYGKNSQAIKMSGYSESDSNLGNMPTGDLSAVISSPPFVESLATNLPNVEYQKERQRKRGRNPEAKGAGVVADYGKTEGQIGAMREGEFSAVITSPPFVESLASDEPLKRGGLFKDPARANDKTLTATYGTTDGQLGAMKAGAVITSPPYESAINDRRHHEESAWARESNFKQGKTQGLHSAENYGQTEGNIGNSTGDTFWAASKTILEQCHEVLAPNAKAIFVCKDFVRKGKRVEFCRQWAMLCEAVGFRLLHWHKSWLVEKHGEQHAMDGEIDSIETHRKSFLRILAERKGSPRIDYEIVMCLERI